MILRVKKYSILLIIFLFFAIYYPPLFKINFLHIIGAISWVYILFHIKTIYKNQNIKKISKIYLLLSLLALYTYIVAYFNDNSFRIIAIFLYWIFDIIPACIVTLDVCYRKKYKEIDLINIILIVGNIQGLLALLAFIYPNFKSAFMNRMIYSGFQAVYLQLAEVRMYGVSSNLTYSTPIIQSMFAMIALYLAINKNIKYILFVPLTVFSAVINARTSVVIMLIGIVAILLSAHKIRIKQIYRVTIIVFFSVVIISLIMYFVQKYAGETYKWLNDGIGEIIGFINGDKIGYFTYVSNSSMYSVPSGIDFIFGKGILAMGEMKYNAPSDIGWINDIWMGGIIYSIVIYISFLYILFQIYFCNNKKIAINKFLAIFSLGIFLVGNFKGIIISSNEFMTVIFLIVLYVKNYKLVAMD